MSKIIKIILVIIVLFIGFIFIYNKSNSESSIKQIDDSKSIIIQYKNDSIDQVIDTIYITLKENNKRYEENNNVIINNSVDENYVFFTNYINRNKSRLDSINNF